MASVSDLQRLIDEAGPGVEGRRHEVAEDEDLLPVDWRRLFPRSAPRDRGKEDWDVYGDDWQPAFPPEVLERVTAAARVGSGRNPHPEAPCGGPTAMHRCAWYEPLHTHPAGWGIYLREACVLDRMIAIAAAIRLPYSISPLFLKALYRVSAYGLFLHEQFHHKIESLGFRLLVVEGRLRYLDYDRNVYRKLLGTNACLEEALANADAYRRLGESAYRRWFGPSLLDAARLAMSAGWTSAPPGYNQAGLYISESSYRDALATLAAQVHEGIATPSRTRAWRSGANMHESMLPITANIWTVVPTGTRPLMPLRKFRSRPNLRLRRLLRPSAGRRSMVGVILRSSRRNGSGFRRSGSERLPCQRERLSELQCPPPSTPLSPRAARSMPGRSCTR